MPSSVDLQDLLWLAGRGWRLFPIHSVTIGPDRIGRCTCGKYPCGKDNTNAGKHPFDRATSVTHATSDKATIERWYAQRPGANWAVRCGDKLTVFDLDNDANARVLRDLICEHGGRIETLMVATGRGHHVYFEGDVGGSHTIGPTKLLVRGGNSYVILPGSLHASGRRYAWVDRGATVAPLPAWLREWVLAANPSAPQAAPEPAIDLGPRPSWIVLGDDPTQRALDQVGGKELTATYVIQELSRIPSDSNMLLWRKIACGLHDFDSGPLGLEIFKRWSWRSPKHQTAADQARCDYEWSRIKKRKPGKRMATIRTVLHEAAKYPPAKLQQTPSTTDKVNGTHTPLASFGGNGENSGTFAAGTADIVRPVVWVDVDEDDRPRPTCTNAAIAIGGLGVGCSHDTFHDRLLVGGHFIQQWAGDLTDNAVHMLRRNIKRHFRFDPGEKSTRDAATQLCLENPFNPVVDYLAGLQWDGRSRIGRWVTDYLGAPDDPLGQEFGRLMLVAAVRRARAPGTKFDQILVWEGREGTGKSTALRILAGDENFSDQRVLGVSEREQQEAVAGVWIHEIAELAGMRRTEVEHVKAFASKTEDRARPAYGRFRVDRKRQCIFVATTNAEAYLKSDTGDRRFWPLSTGHVRLDELARDRDQLWAEAAHVEARGEPLALDWRLWPEAARVQASRQERDLWYDKIAAWVVEKNVHDTSITEVLENYLHMQPREYGQAEQNRIARTLRHLNFDRYRKRIGDALTWRYKRGNGGNGGNEKST